MGKFCILLVFLVSGSTGFLRRHQREVQRNSCAEELKQSSDLLNDAEINGFCDMEVSWREKADVAEAAMNASCSETGTQSGTGTGSATDKTASDSHKKTGFQKLLFDDPISLDNGEFDDIDCVINMDDVSNHIRHWALCKGEQCLMKPMDPRVPYDPSIHGNLADGDKPLAKARRKEYRMLTDEERQRFHDALRKMKTEIILEDAHNNRRSLYDVFASFHEAKKSPAAHGGPSFLPFHRHLLKGLELELRRIDRSLALPYWDSSLDEGLPTPSDSILWSHAFLGNSNGFVTTGPFANWATTQPLQPDPTNGLSTAAYYLYRNMKSGELPYNPDGRRYWFVSQNITNEIVQDAARFQSLCRFEELHAFGHQFIGGFLNHIEYSPNDPAFFLHHNFIDFLWEHYRQQLPREQRETSYPEGYVCCPGRRGACHRYSKDYPMRPFDLRNGDGLLNSYTDNFYEFDPQPSCNQTIPSCGSNYLFCNTAKNPYRCMSKIKRYGNCKGLEGQKGCYESTCRSGICS